MQYLKGLKRRFGNWRANKLTLAEPVPSELWQEVKRALKHISSSLLCRELKITQHQMRLHCDFGKRIEPNNHCGEFIEIAPENQINSTTPAMTTRSEKHELLFSVNNNPITLKLASNNLLSVLNDLKKAL